MPLARRFSSRHALAAAALAAGAWLQWPSAFAQQTPSIPTIPVIAPVHKAEVPPQLRSYVPVTNEMLLRPAPGNWITFRNGYRLWGYSEINQITASNVGRLRLVWARAMPEGPQEVEPFVYNGVMFLLQARDLLQALDARTGDLLWEYQRALPPDAAATGSLFSSQAQADRVDTYLNGTLLWTITDHAFPAGNLGFQLEGAATEWRNVRVRAE